MKVMHSFHQAIVTKYLGPTNHRGSRVKATCEAGSVTVAWDDALDVADNHAKAVRALLIKLDWDRSFIGGGTKDGYVFVLAKNEK